MLEAVNSVLQSAPLVRATTDRLSPVESFAANPQAVQRGAQAPFISPFVFLDVNFDAAVIQFRDSETGDVIQQVPSESSLEFRRRELANEARPAVHPQAESQPQRQPSESELAFVQSTTPRESQSSSTGHIVGATPQQLAAFQAAAQTAQKSGSSESTTSVVA